MQETETTIEQSARNAEAALESDAAAAVEIAADPAPAAVQTEDAAEADTNAATVKERRKLAEKTFASKVTLRTKILIALVLVAVAVISLFLGHYGMSPAETVGAVGTYIPKLLTYLGYCIQDPSLFFDPNFSISMTSEERVLFLIRLPRVIVVVLCGAALAVAGASYQGMFKNPLTSPDLLGASAGASLGACIALLLSLSGEFVQLFAFIGGMVAVGMAVWLNKMVDYDPTLGLVLAGILVSTLFQSGMSLVKLMADSNDKLPEITFWLMGSFASVNVQDILVFIPMVVGFIILLTQSWKLNVLSFGDEEARAMGVNTSRTRLLVIFASTMITSSSVAVAGIIGWIGLVIPHLARAVVGPNYRVLLPASMFVGGAYLLVVDDLARLLAAVEIPIGILTAILGVPFFVYIFKRNMKGWR